MNILIITFWDFHDALIQAYTLPYVRIIKNEIPPGSKIYLVTQQKTSLGIDFADSAISIVPFRYSNFGIVAGFRFLKNLVQLLILIKRRRVDTIHCWCTPAGVYGVILKFLTRKRLVIDSFEPHAEPMVEAGVWKKSGIAFKVLFLFEKLQAQYADYLIACVDIMKEYTKIKYGVERPDMQWKPACVDFEIFNHQIEKPKDLIDEFHGKIVCVYAGKFGGSYLKTEVFELLATAYSFWGDRFRFLLLSNHPKDEIENLCLQTGFPNQLIRQLFVPYNEVPRYLAISNFGLVPFIPVPSKRYGSPIKTGEYLAMGLPIIITSDISDDSDLIESEDIGYTLKNLSRTEYLHAIKKIDQLLQDNGLPSRIIQLGKKSRSFNFISKIYDGIYHS